MTAPNIHEIITLIQSEYPHSRFNWVGGNRDNHWFEREDVTPLNKGKENSITFCSYKDSKAVEAIRNSKASYIICDWNLYPTRLAELTDDKFYIFTENPRLFFMRMLTHFNLTFAPREEYMSFSPSHNNIDKTVSFKGEVFMGNQNNIDPYVVIGQDGFGYERNERGILEKFPHLGGVMIGSEVDIGASTAIDRATLPGEYTIVEDWCKLDNFVHVAHNVKIDKRTIVVSHCNIGGSVQIGKQCYLAMSVTIQNGVKIGNRCILGNRANIRQDVPDNTVVIGDDQIIGDVDEKESWVRLVGPLLSAPSR